MGLWKTSFFEDRGVQPSHQCQLERSFRLRSFEAQLSWISLSPFRMLFGALIKFQ